MTRQDIVDTLRLEVARAPDRVTAQVRLDAGLKAWATQYAGNPDELRQVMAVYARSKTAFDEALNASDTATSVLMSPGQTDHSQEVVGNDDLEHPLEGLADHPDDVTQRFENLVDEREPKAGDEIGKQFVDPSTLVLDDVGNKGDPVPEWKHDPDLDDDGHDDSNGQFVEKRFSTKAERDAKLTEVFGEIADDEKPRPIEEVFGEVGDATASAPVEDGFVSGENVRFQTGAPEPEPAPAPKGKKSKSKGKRNDAKDLV